MGFYLISLMQRFYSFKVFKNTMGFILRTASSAILVVIIIGIFPAASSYMAGSHTRYLHCPYPSGNTAYLKEFYIAITKESDLKSCKLDRSCYLPDLLVINCYSKVTWQNEDYTAHLISSGSQAHGPDGWFGSKAIFPGAGFSFIFDRPGIYSFFDPLHSWAQGTIIVKSGDNNTDSAWLNFVKGPNCTLGEPHCAHPSLR
jgi:plastocyanin